MSGLEHAKQGTLAQVFHLLKRKFPNGMQTVGLSGLAEPFLALRPVPLASGTQARLGLGSALTGYVIKAELFKP